MNIYICASFCYEDKKKTIERKYLIEKTVDRLQEQLGTSHHYYLPHKLTIPNAWDISLEEWSSAVYQHDMEALHDAHIVIFLSFGKENNAGSVWEIGYVAGKNSMKLSFDEQKIIMVKMTDEIESLMVTNSVHAIIKESEIEDYAWTSLPEYKTGLSKIS